MAELGITLRIDKVGDREAIDGLNSLTISGQKIVERFTKATGTALSDAIAQYKRLGDAAAMEMLRTAVAAEDSAKKQVASIDTITAAAEKHHEVTEEHVGRAIRGIAVGAEQIVRTGNLAGQAFDRMLERGAEIMLGFGPGGAIVGAIAVATAAIVEMFRHTREESKDLAADIAKQFEHIAQMDVLGQGQAAAELYNGNPNAADPAKRFGIAELRRQKEDFEARLLAGTFADPESGVSMTKDASEAAKALEVVEKRLQVIEALYASIMGGSGGVGGTLRTAGVRQAAEDLPGFTTDALKAAEDARKEREKDAARAAREAAKDAADRAREMLSDAKDVAQYLIQQAAPGQEARSGIYAELVPDGNALGKAIHDNVTLAFELGLVRNDPIVAFQKSVKELAKRMHDALARTLGDSISAGFEAAFAGKGITGAFKALTATVLAGLGGFMEQLGAQMIVVGVSLEALSGALLSLNGPAAIAAGIALVAAGAGLKAIAGSFGGGVDAGSPAGYGGGGVVAAPSFLSFGVSAGPPPSTSLAAPAARTPLNFTIIGNDPKVQRDIAAIVNAADDRNLLTVGGRR